MQSKNEYHNHQAKLLLQLLICIINAELFKAVNLKGFKSAKKSQHLSMPKFTKLTANHNKKYVNRNTSGALSL